MAKGKPVIAIDIGGTKIAGAWVYPSGHIEKMIMHPTPPQGGKRALRSIITLIKELKKRSLAKNLGVAAPGPLLKKAILMSPANLRGWKWINLRQTLSRASGLRTFVENDANAAALAEFLFGAGKGSRCMVYITVSTGIGGGIIYQGKIFDGSAGGAGEVGHMKIVPNGPKCGCGERGCLEALASGTAMANRAKRDKRLRKSIIWRLAQGRLGKINARLIGKAAQKGDPLAKKIIQEGADYLGIGLANVINAFNPDRIVLGGGVSTLGELLIGGP